jgi:hypothetical protein
MFIKILEKYELSSVIFVRDYLEFIFEGEKDTAKLAAFSLPSAVVSSHEYNILTGGWRDALCSLINKVVLKADDEDGLSIKITFENGDKLEISLLEEDYIGPEAAMLSNDNGELCVWN